MSFRLHICVRIWLVFDFVGKYIYRAPLITSESEALGFAAKGH